VQEYVVDLETRQRLTGVRVQNVDHPEQTTEIIPCDGVFVMIGSIPNTQFLAEQPEQQVRDPKLVHVDLSKDGLIQLPTNKQVDGAVMIATTTMSSVPGIFAAGEVTDNVYKQAITAAAAGAQAAIDAERWLREQHNNSPGSTAATQRRRVPENIPLQNFPTTRITATIKTKEAASRQSKGKEGYDDGSNSCDLATEACITALVNKHPVVVFSKPYCPYCKKALESLSLEGVAEEPYLKVVNLLGGGIAASQARAIQTTLGRMTGRVTVPNVFVGGISIGGGDETYELHRQGQLRQLLRDARAYPPPTECNLAEEDCLQAMIAKFPVLVFSKNYCPHCKQAIELFDLEGVKGTNNLHVIDLMQYENYSDIQDTLAKMTNRRTVPNIFVGGRNLGGTTEVEGMQQTGKLRGYLERAKAFA
jgi:glutaredoxin 3